MNSDTPHNPVAEKAVLGSILIDNEAYDLIASIVVASHFHDERHRQIFTAIQELADKNSPMDAVTVSEWMERKMGNQVTLSDLGALVQDTPSAANVQAYARIVRGNAAKRQVLSVSDSIRHLALSGEIEADALVDEATSQLLDIDITTTTEPASVVTIMADVIDQIDYRSQHQGEVAGLGTGFGALDRITSGFQNGDLIILAARPSVGKTALALNIAAHASINERKNTLVFSMEQPSEQLVERLVASSCSINLKRLRTGALQEDDYTRLGDVGNIIDSAPLYIDDASSMTIHQLAAKARRHKRKHGLDVLFVDYLQIMRYETKTTTNDAVAAISKGLKALAKDLRIPVVCLSQLNRGFANRQDKRPTMTDLRDSGQIEQDADVIMFIHREEMVNPKALKTGQTELIIDKNRNGEQGRINLQFHGQYCRFVESDPYFDNVAPINLGAA